MLQKFVSNIINIGQFHACYNLRWFYDEHKYCMYYLIPVMKHLHSENHPKKNHVPGSMRVTTRLGICMHQNS